MFHVKHLGRIENLIYTEKQSLYNERIEVSGKCGDKIWQRSI